MEQSKELTKVKERIRRLAEVKVERGATEHEVNHAVITIGKLLDTFNLEMSEVFLSQEKCVELTVDTKSKHRNVGFLTAHAVSSFCQVKWWQSRQLRSKGIVIGYFGLESDVQMAIFLTEMIVSAADTAVLEFKQSENYLNPHRNRRALTFAFYNGMAWRLNKRLADATNERLVNERQTAAFHAEQMKERMVSATDEAKAAAAKITTGTALVSVKKEEHIDKEWKIKTKGWIKKGTKTKAYDQIAREHGARAADKVNLSRPLTHERSASMLQISHSK